MGVAFDDGEQRRNEQPWDTVLDDGERRHDAHPMVTVVDDEEWRRDEHERGVDVHGEEAAILRDAFITAADTDGGRIQVQGRRASRVTEVSTGNFWSPLLLIEDGIEKHRCSEEREAISASRKGDVVVEEEDKDDAAMPMVEKSIESSTSYEIQSFLLGTGRFGGSEERKNISSGAILCEFQRLNIKA
ncbi:hypothetical protein VNO80_27030 [Phaseolus coccineus]|uniref:Uncharacterized protein n=1 Tax=Phaseolus coccineus TaxID=3886 RepID=A0AAN9QL06_PHACN